MTLYKNKYRIETARLQGWDYGSNASYFVTICTKEREHFFGEIADGKMILSELGKCADKCWQEITKHFPFVVLDEYVVMPNHIHGIVIIDKPADVETQNFASLPPPPPSQSKNKFGPQSQNLGSNIRGSKQLIINQWNIEAYLDLGWNDEPFRSHADSLI
ncbi:hypothetical protein BH23BAC1_BH23BAC1_45930 [soil metagenome]